jgi:hypothetical protein
VKMCTKVLLAAALLASCKTSDPAVTTCKLQIHADHGIAEVPLRMKRADFLQQFGSEFATPVANEEERRYYQLDDLYVSNDETTAVNFDYDDQIWTITTKRKDLCLGATPLVGADLRKIRDSIIEQWPGKRPLFDDARQDSTMLLENDAIKIELDYNQWIIETVSVSLKNARIDPFE